jgi:hypothetical protein
VFIAAPRPGRYPLCTPRTLQRGCPRQVAVPRALRTAASVTGGQRALRALSPRTQRGTCPQEAHMRASRWGVAARRGWTRQQPASKLNSGGSRPGQASSCESRQPSSVPSGARREWMLPGRLKRVWSPFGEAARLSGERLGRPSTASPAGRATSSPLPWSQADGRPRASPGLDPSRAGLFSLKPLRSSGLHSARAGAPSRSAGSSAEAGDENAVARMLAPELSVRE